MTTIQLAGHSLVLLPERAAYWPTQRALLLADVHLGKDQVFRRSGIAVPVGMLAADLQRIDTLLEATAAERLIVLGDWVHAPPRPDDAWPEQVTRWRQGHRSLSMDLVLGNHDRALAPWLERWHIGIHRPWLDVDGLRLVHDWTETRGQAGISGHLHPGAIVKNRRQRLRLPAFLLAEDHLVLPAFGSFTGLMTEPDFPTRRCFAVAGERLVELPA